MWWIISIYCEDNQVHFLPGVYIEKRERGCQGGEEQGGDGYGGEIRISTNYKQEDRSNSARGGNERGTRGKGLGVIWLFNLVIV